MVDIQQVLSKYGVGTTQWTTTPESYALRFRLDGRNYLFVIPVLGGDPQETRRLLRVVWHFLDSMFAAMDGSIFSPERVLLSFLEVSPEITLGEIMADDSRLSSLRDALGGGRLALEPHVP